MTPGGLYKGLSCRKLNGRKLCWIQTGLDPIKRQKSIDISTFMDVDALWQSTKRRMRRCTIFIVESSNVHSIVVSICITHTSAVRPKRLGPVDGGGLSCTQTKQSDFFFFIVILWPLPSCFILRYVFALDIYLYNKTASIRPFHSRRVRFLYYLHIMYIQQDLQML